MEVFIIWLAFAIITAFAASARGRSAVGWFFLGLLFSALALILVLVMRNLSEQGAQAQPAPMVSPTQPRNQTRHPHVIARHRGRDITLRDKAYWVGTQKFTSEYDAKRHIEDQQKTIHQS